MEQDARSVVLSNDDADKLRKTYATMIGTVAANTLSMELKNNDYDGVVEKGGSVVVNRLETSISRDYGTARAAGEGDKPKNNPVTMLIDTGKEIVEEIARYDADRHSIPDFIARRQTNHSLSMSVQLDKDYFKVLQDNSTVADLSGESEVEDKILLLIQTLEAVENDHVEKVDRALMELTLAPKWYDQLIKYMNTLPNPNGQDYKTLHDVKVHKAVRQGFDAIVQVRGSVAQPVKVYPYNPERIPLSNDVAIELFYDYGTEAIMPDLIYAGALDADISA